MSDETETEGPAETEAEAPDNADTGTEVPLNDLSDQQNSPSEDASSEDEAEAGAHTAGELEAVFDVPVRIKAILGKTQMEVSELLKVGKGTVIELDRKVGEAIDIFVNNRLVARGEVVLVEDRLGITMTEMIKQDRS